MNLSRHRYGFTILSAMLVVLASRSSAQEGKKDAKADRVEKGEGVIVRVAPIDEKSDQKKGEAKEPRRVKVTINTAVVWSDFVRDQASFAAKPDAKTGANSVATKGQPESATTDVVVEVAPDTNLMLRYRSTTDETSAGSRTIEKAEKKDGSPASDEVKTSPRDEKAPKMTVNDLKAGLFVEVEAKKGKAAKLVVLKPVGGPQTPASEAAPKK